MRVLEASIWNTSSVAALRLPVAWAICVACMILVGVGTAHARSDMPKLGVLWISDPETAEPYLRPVKAGLKDLGWIDGRNIQILERYDHGDASRRPALAAELVALGVDVLYVSDPWLPTARSATKTIPIVCADFFDPIQEGVTTSLARPDRNVTGLSWQSVDAASKRLQLMKELIPRVRRVGMMLDANDPGGLIELRGVSAAAKENGITIERLDLRGPADIAPALAKLSVLKIDALLVSANWIVWPSIERIVGAAATYRIPVVSEPTYFAEVGAVLTYGPEVLAMYRRGAYFIDRILRGASPGDLPIEQPTLFDLSVNLRTAATLGIQLPPSILVRATKVIR